VAIPVPVARRNNAPAVPEAAAEEDVELMHGVSPKRMAIFNSFFVLRASKTDTSIITHPLSHET